MPSGTPTLELLFSRDQIQQRVIELGNQITRDFAGQPLVLVGVLKGAAIFLADLARAIALDCSFDFLTASSYGAQRHSSGSVHVLTSAQPSLQGKNVLLVEDILDTGITLHALQNLLLTHQPAMFKIVALLDKPSRRVQAVHADYVGFTIPDRFVVGYGMDDAEHYRNLPDIYWLTPDI